MRKKRTPDSELSFEALEKRWTPLMEKFVKRCWVSERDDVLQELRLRLWRAQRKFDPTRGAQFGTYLYRAFHNALAGQFNHHHPHDSLDESLIDPGIVDVNIDIAELLCEASPNTQRIADLIIGGATWRDIKAIEPTDDIAYAQNELQRLLRDTRERR